MGNKLVTEFEIRNHVFKAFIEDIPVFMIEKHINRASISQQERDIALSQLEDLIEWKANQIITA